MLTPVRTGAPAELPVTLAEAKAHLRVDHSDQDNLISALLQAATDHLDGWSGILGRALVTQTWRADFDAFPACQELRLPLAPVQSISGVAYWDAANADQTFAAESYAVLSEASGPLLVLNSGYSWPSTYARGDAVRVTFVAGYGTAAAVPAPLKQAMKLHVERLYKPMDEAARQQNQAAYDTLVSPFRRWVL